MISYEENTNKFNFRVGGIIESPDKKKILIHRLSNFDFWLLPGGRVEMLEDTKKAILREIEEELIKLNYIKSLHNKKKTKLKKEVKYGLIEGEDYLILYGRNNLENDNLTFKISEKNDYWFHVKDIPSSHIILKATKLTDELIVKAAQVSAYYSKANLGEKVTVDYTLRKNVSKPNGAKPGFVIYVSQKSVVVEKVELDKI